MAMYGGYLLIVFFAPILRKQMRGGELVAAADAPADAPSASDYVKKDDETDEDDNDEPGPLMRPFKPLFALIEATCPACEADSPTAHLYWITLLSAFLWLAVFSAVRARSSRSRDLWVMSRDASPRLACSLRGCMRRERDASPRLLSRAAIETRFRRPSPPSSRAGACSCRCPRP